ncbi:DcaP family trimeric outer membrane transporter [Acinetobacter apis]|uniref:Porin subfamily protein n=1 Tax=Acinetobacter apis TaxID=1229165 RepID=A0A217EED9_9GAMM|nr:DcaP family trimeric outer membrane transporter [Acinetobacter apis]SNQ28744.1 Porin subfamily protein [Acinetobacter apis]
MFKDKLSVLTSLVVMSGASYAETAEEREVRHLNKEVLLLQDQLTDLLAKQKKIKEAQPSYVIASQPPATVESAPSIATSKPGWMTLSDGKTSLKLYGSFRIHSTYDFKGGNAGTTDIYNPTNKAPLNREHATRGALNVSAATSVVGLEIQRKTDYGLLKGVFEGDFMGSATRTNGNGAFRIRHAYASLGSWLVGQTTSPFISYETTPSTVDANGPIGSNSNRAVQIRYTRDLAPHHKVLVALEGGNVDGFTGEKSSNIMRGGRIPALTAKYDYTLPKDAGHLQFFGLLHENRVSNNNHDDKETLGWGLGVGTRINLSKKDTLFFDYYHVKGSNKYILYVSPNPAYIVTQDANGNFHIQDSKYDKVLLGYVHEWTPRWKTSLIAGALWYEHDTPYAHTLASDTRSNKMAYNAIGNIFFTPVKNFNMGMEYTYGQRKTFSNLKGDYSRVNLSLRYNF